MTQPYSSRLAIEVIRPDGTDSTMADDVRRGLTTDQKYLLSKYFYDDAGSELFERITELPEYYQTRTELAILRSIVDDVAREFAFNEVVELGSGSSKKTTALLDALERRGCLERYVPLDVSEEILRDSSSALLTRYPRLRIHGIVGDFQLHLDRVPRADGRRLAIFLGSTLGNLDEHEQEGLLNDVGRMLEPGDGLLLGVDLVKDIQRLERAYNDSAGVTAEFNLNVLRVVNQRLGGNFEVDAFRHHAFYNPEACRIEMHLAPTRPQRVSIPSISLEVSISPPETIRTEISRKYTRETIASALERAGMKLERWYTDPENLFGVLLARHP